VGRRSRRLSSWWRTWRRAVRLG